MPTLTAKPHEPSTLTMRLTKDECKAHLAMKAALRGFGLELVVRKRETGANSPAGRKD